MRRKKTRWGPEIPIEHEVDGRVIRGTYAVSDGPGVQQVRLTRAGQFEGKSSPVGAAGAHAVALHMLIGF